MKVSYYFLKLLFILFLPSFSIAQITGTFTADNSYSVYIGNQSMVTTKVLPSGAANGHTNTLASQIFSPTQNTFNANSSNYFYIIAWSDDKSCQGLLGEFTGSTTIKTGDPGWQVYATNKNYGNNQAPTAAIINQFITTANNSSGWETPFIGPKNIDGKKACSAYRKVNGISNDAKWIWYNSTNSTNARDVLGRGRNHKEFLIFRFPVKQITSGGTQTPEIGKCDCIPERVYDVDLTSSIFEVKDVTGPVGNFTYKLKFKPHNQYAALSNSWNAWINAAFGFGNGNTCQIVHQYILYEYTSNTPGVIATETFLEQFWSTPNYLSNPGNFTTTLQSNKKYYIKHGAYYGSPNNGKCILDKECNWSESRFFLDTRTGDSPKVRIMDSKGKVRKLLPTKLKSKKFRKR